MSASVRYPWRAISAAVTIVTDEGASVTGCRRSDAPNTRCTSMRIRSSISTCARSDGPCAAAGVACSSSNTSRYRQFIGGASTV